MKTLADATDEEMVRTGDLTSLIRRYYGPVHGLALRLLDRPAEARDAAQETFARALAHFHEFDPSRSFRSWIFAIAANHIRDLHRRKRQVPLDSELEESLPELSLPDDRILREENRDRLLAAIGALPFDLKVVVALHFQQELSFGEIADTLRVTVNAVRIRLYRALQALRKELS